MPRYEVDSNACRVTTTARSSIHDTVTRWGKVSGWIDVELDPTLEAGDTRAELSVDMTDFDAGDFLKNRKLRRDFELDRHPTAKFILDTLRDVERQGPEEFTAAADGRILWRGHDADITARGHAHITAQSIRATASFRLDVTKLRVEPPRFLMFKVEPVVDVDVVVVANAAPEAVTSK